MRVARIFLSRQPRGSDAATIVVRPRDRYLAKPVAWRSLQQAILEATGATSDSNVVATAGHDGSSGATDGAGLRVLLVEDNPVNQLVAEGMLRRLGYAVTSVVDGRSALTRVSTEPYDIVLMDCQMPIMDGLAATRLIRGLPGDAGAVPIIGLTADASTEARAACQAAGMSDYLSKPYTLEQLRAVLARHVTRATELRRAGAGQNM
jgi:CheY-like chemotaxis protein